MDESDCSDQEDVDEQVNKVVTDETKEETCPDERLKMEQIIIRERERTALKEFYSKMNETSRNLGLTKVTNWAVSHGMHHDYNYSSALDVATISWNVMR